MTAINGSVSVNIASLSLSITMSTFAQKQVRADRILLHPEFFKFTVFICSEVMISSAHQGNNIQDRTKIRVNSSNHSQRWNCRIFKMDLNRNSTCSE
jgi:hypothetical protein